MINELKPFSITVCAVMPATSELVLQLPEKRAEQGSNSMAAAIERAVAVMESDEGERYGAGTRGAIHLPSLPKKAPETIFIRGQSTNFSCSFLSFCRAVIEQNRGFNLRINVIDMTKIK